MTRVLITGSGTGFGYEAAMRLAEKGFDVIAAVEIWAQVQTLKRQAAERGVELQVEKLDVTDAGDRKKALTWDVEILVNNAGVGEGHSNPRHPGGQRTAAVRGERHRAVAADPGHRQADGQTGRGAHRLGVVASSYRNLEPKSMLDETKRLIEAPWSKKTRDGLGTRPPALQKSYEMTPETPVAE